MKLEIGQFWTNIHIPGFAYKVTEVDHTSEDTMACFVEVWLKGPEESMFLVTNNDYIVTHKPFYHEWVLLNF